MVLQKKIYLNENGIFEQMFCQTRINAGNSLTQMEIFIDNTKLHRNKFANVAVF